MEREFTVPIHPEDLLKHSIDQYFVAKKLDSLEPSEVETILDGITDRLRWSDNNTEEDGPLAIIQHENFDALFSIVSKTSSLQNEHKTHLFEILHTGLGSLVDLTHKTFGAKLQQKKKQAASNNNNNKKSRAGNDYDYDDEGDMSEDMDRGRDREEEASRAGEDHQQYQHNLLVHRNAVKMYVWLLQWLVSVEEIAFVKKGSAALPEKGRKTKKPKLEEDRSSFWEDENQRERFLSTLLHVLDLDLSRLWSGLNPEETFTSLFSKLVFQMMENTANTKCKPVKSALFLVVSALVKKYNHAYAIVNIMVDQLHKFEHIVGPLVDMVETVVKDTGAETLVNEMMREVGKISFKELARNSIAAKNLSAFIADMAEQLPKLVLPNVSLLMSHFEGESYMMRNGVIQVLGFLIHKAFASAASDETGDAAASAAATTSTRDSLLDVLLERFHDVKSFTRSKVLQTWAYLAQNRAIPLKLYHRVAEEAVDRLDDKGAHVRKSAIQLITSLLENNPYSPQLPLSTFRQNLSKVVKGLEEKTGKSVDDLIALQEDEEMPQSQEDPLPQEDLNTLKMVHYYRDSIRFIEQIHVAMPSVCDLLGSKNASDVIETIQFFIMAHNFSIEKARDGVRKMLLLVWSKEANIKQAVCDAFVTLYLSPPKSLDSAKRRCLYIVKNLIAWTLDSNLGELTSLEELVVTLSKDGKIPGPVVDMLWEVFAQKYKKDKASEGRGALIVLSMLANTDPSIVKNQLNILVKIGLGPRAYRDPTLAKWTCIALQKLSNRTTTSSPSTATTKKEKDAEKAASEAAAAASASAPHVRYNSSHLLFAKLAQLVKSDIATSKWFPAAEQAINAIFLLAENPDVLMGTIVREMAVGLFPQIFPGVTVTTGKLTSPETSPTKGKKPPVDDDEDMDVDAEEESVEGVPAGVVAGKDHALSRVGKLSKLFFVLGHSAIKQLVYVEEVIKAMKMKNDQQSKKKAAASTTKSSKKGGKKSAGKGQEDDEDLEAIEKELGVTNADTAEDETSRRKIEQDIVESNLLGAFAPLIVKVCSNEGNKYTDPFLRSAAVSALCKFMLVSPTFCNLQLQLLFSILEGKDTPALRANIVIALGDIAFRFPNLIEPYTKYIYNRLHDQDITVRKNTLMVLTHLILNDMIKPKGQISDMALCLEDGEPRIADLAKLFFHELTFKANAMYNIIPDLISGLSITPDVQMDSVKNIVRFIFSFIQKEKQLESLVEKLCNRYPTTGDVKQWKYISYCLSVLNWNERSVKKLSDLFKLYKEPLNDPTVHAFFMQIVGKARKFAKPETKSLLDDLEARLQAVAENAPIAEGEERVVDTDALDEIAPKKSRGRGGKKAGKASGAKRGGAAPKKRKRGFEDDDEEDDGGYGDDDDDDDDLAMDLGDDDDEEEPMPRKPAKKVSSTRVARATTKVDSKKRKTIEDSDGDDDHESEETPAPSSSRRRAIREDDDDDDNSGVDDQDQSDNSEVEDVPKKPKRAAKKAGGAAKRTGAAKKAGGAKKAAAKPRAKATGRKKKVESEEEEDDDRLEESDDEAALELDSDSDEPASKKKRGTPAKRVAAPKKKAPPKRKGRRIDDDDDDDDDGDDGSDTD